MNDLESIKRINDAHAKKIRARDAKVEKVRAGHRRAAAIGGKKV